MKRLFALLLLAVVVAVPAWAQSQQDGVVFSPQSIVVNPRPGFEVDVFLERGSGSDVPTYRVGESIRIGVEVSEDAYVYLFNVRPNGQVQQLLPNRYDEAGQNNRLRAGQTRYFPPQNARYTFDAEPPRGLDKVIAVASQSQLDTRQLAQFEDDPNFATSDIGEEGFAQQLSIVVRPIEQNNWVTDTALLYVGEQPQQAAYGTLEIRTSPSDAEVYVDGEFVGYSPVNYGTRPGRHDIRVERSGYETWRETVNVRPGSTATVDARLRQVQRSGSVSFTSSPSGAEVYVNGNFIGTTPTRSVSLDAGSYTARFRLGGYQEANVNFDVRAGGNQTVNARMQSQRGSLVVQANVGGARVYVDGEFRGNIASGSGQLRVSDLSSGSHELVVVAPGYRTYRNEIRIDSGRTTEVRVRQERR